MHTMSICDVPKHFKALKKNKYNKNIFINANKQSTKTYINYINDYYVITMLIIIKEK